MLEVIEAAAQPGTLPVRKSMAMTIASFMYTVGKSNNKQAKMPRWLHITAMSKAFTWSARQWISVEKDVCDFQITTARCLFLDMTICARPVKQHMFLDSEATYDCGQE